jgi:protein-S-isoprenylcysteine O-methyltransferase Ste14
MRSSLTHFLASDQSCYSIPDFIKKWTPCAGISGRHPPESVDGLRRNWWSVSPGLCTVEIEDTSIVVTGLYHIIRHPISLANILFCIACPLFLAAGPSWIPALMGILGVILRISIEESFMAQHIPDYADYKKRTWALLPYIY